MIERRVTPAPPAIWTAAFAGIAALFAWVAVRFAAGQSVWTDEATQLSGLSLGFTDQLRWLAGRLPQAFTVPIDRMPPLSYWLGSLWTHAFGDGVMTVRLLSVCLSIASVFTVWRVARQFLEDRPALLGAALLALSPNFVVESAEIRAYAAFILFSTLLIYCYVRLLAVKPAPSGLDLWAFALVATLCSYTHFFGIVISGGAFLCLLTSYARIDWAAHGRKIMRKAVWPLLFYLTSFMGLIPFIHAAVKNSNASEVTTADAALSFSVRLHDFIKLAYRLFGHQSMLGIPGLSAAALLAGLTLMAFAMIPGANLRARQLMLFFLVNLGLITMMGLTTRAFNAFSSSYNAWALPVTALLAAGALTHRNRRIRAVSVMCISVLIAADCYSAVRLSTAGEIYAHTRTTVVQSAVDSAGSDNVVALYGNDAPAIYFAMMYDFHGRLRQYIPGGSGVHLLGSAVGSSTPWICDRNADTLLVAEDLGLSAETLQFLIAHPDVHTQAYRALNDFLDAHQAELGSRWTLVSTHDYLSQTALALAIFKRARVDEPAISMNCNAR